MPHSEIIKKRKIESQKAVKRSRIFSPFRVVGNITNETPFAIGSLGSTFYIVTSIGKSFQIYDASNLNLLFISSVQLSKKITSIATHFHYVYASYGNKVGIFKRGKLMETIEIDSNETINNLLVFGDSLVISTPNELFVYKKAPSAKLPLEYYTSIKISALDGEINKLVHPATYLNKVIVSTTKHLFIINIKTTKVLFKSEEYLTNISTIEPLPILDLLSVGFVNGEILIINFRKNQTVKKINTGSFKVNSISFRTDGSSHMVAGLSNGDLYFFDLEKNARLHVLARAHKDMNGGVSKVSFLNGQPILITNGGDNSIKEFVFDPSLSTSNSSIVSPPRHLRSRGGHSLPPNNLLFMDEKNHFILTSSKDESLWSFSLRKDSQSQELSQRTTKKKTEKIVSKLAEITCIASNNVREGDWENIITGHKDDTFARTWDARNKKIGRWKLSTNDEGVVKSVCMSQCGNFGVVGSSNGSIVVYNLQSGIRRRTYKLHKKAVTGICMDDMNNKMCSVGLDGIVGFYSFNQAKYLGKLDLQSSITSLTFNKTSNLIGLALDNLSIVVVDLTTEKVIRELYGHTNRITSLDFSPNGRWLISSSLDSTLRTWDLPTGGCIDGIKVKSVITNAKFSPSGDYIATTHVSGNGVMLWNNKGQFKPISTRHIDDESEFVDVELIGDAGFLEGVFEKDDTNELEFTSYESLDQIDENLITLSLGPRNKFNYLVNIDNIKKRNKPTEAPKKPENAPFFLQLSGEQIGDQARVNEGAASTDSTKEDVIDSRLNKLNDNSTFSFESDFTKRLREASAGSSYKGFLDYLVGLSPAATELEIKAISTLYDSVELTNFVKSLAEGLKLNYNYDLIQSYMSLIYKAHGDFIISCEDEDLQLALQNWDASNKFEEFEDLIKYCSGVINFITTV